MKNIFFTWVLCLSLAYGNELAPQNRPRSPTINKAFANESHGNCYA